MGKKKNITNAMRMLTSAGIEFEAIEYNGDGLLEGGDFGMKISELTGIPPEMSFKTLVGRGDKNGVNVFCIPVNAECDLKKVAAASGNKRVELIHVKELLALTGYIRGGVSPIGMKKKYPTYIDESCLLHQKMAISAGVCGETLVLAPEDVIKATDAKTADITR